jgi:cell wall-associated NlpC family hydrolase
MQQGVAQGPWIMAEPPQAFDVMVARRDMHSRYPGHVGVMIDAGRVLHIWEGRDVHISRIGEPTLAGLILGFYRHRSVA